MTNEELIKLGYEMLGETEGEIKIPPMKPMREFIKTSIEALKFIDSINTIPESMEIQKALQLLEKERQYMLQHGGDELAIALEMAIETIKTQRPKGKWIHWTDDYKDYVTCSCCEYGAEGEVLLSDKTPFCPICGADMREIENDEDID